MSETEKNLPDDLREGIEDVRLANHAIRACIRLLAEDSINAGSQADGPMPFIGSAASVPTDNEFLFFLKRINMPAD